MAKEIKNTLINLNNDYIISKDGITDEAFLSEISNLFYSFLQKNKSSKIYLGNSISVNGKAIMDCLSNELIKIYNDVFVFDNGAPSSIPFMTHIFKSKEMNYGIYVSEDSYNKLRIVFYDKDLNHIKVELLENFETKTETSGQIINIDVDEVIKYSSNVTFKSEDKIIDKTKVDVTVSNSFDFVAVQNLINTNKINGKVIIKKLNGTKGDFKTLNMYNGKSLDPVVSQMRKNESDLGINIDASGQLVGVAIKYKRRYKYLTHSDISALYVNYYLGRLSRLGQDLKNGFIFVSTLTFSLVSKIAQKYGVETFEYNGDLNNISKEVITKTGKKFLLGVNELGNIITSEMPQINSLDKTLEVIAMTEYYFETSKTNLFDKLQDFNNEYNVHRQKIEIRDLDPNKSLRLIGRLKDVVKVGDFQIKDKVVFLGNRDDNDITKLVTSNDNSVGVRLYNNKTIVSYESVGDKGQEMIDVVSFERYASDVVTDNLETFELKKFSWKTVFKYSIFVLVAIGILAFIFNLIYKEAGNLTIWEQTKLIFNNELRFVWVFSWFNNIFYVLIGTWKRYRMMKFQKAKLKFHQMLVGNIMGAVISFLTPFAIGGDAIVYWYLRRKGVDRGALIASLMSSTVIYQATIVIQTLVLFPLGFKIYIDIFRTLYAAHPIQASAVLIAFIVGLIWNLFATFMILTLVMYRRFQEFIVKYSIVFLEWFWFTHLYDGGAKAAKVQYEFREMRRGSNMLWRSPIFLIENLFYLLLPFFFRPHTIVFIYLTDFYKNDMSGLEIYFTSMVIGDITSTANSMSLTPGGAGTAEWLNVTLNPYLMDPNYGHNVIPGLTSQEAISSMDLIWKLVSGWPWLLFSAGLIITVIYGEASLEKTSSLNKSLKLSGKETQVKNKYYVYANIMWFSVCACFFGMLCFYPF